MSVDNTSKNIRNLRLAYGETQLDLANALGLESPAAIANYEKGSRIPKPEIRRKIADHYRITEDGLAYGNFSGINVISHTFNDIAKIQEITTTSFPIICTDEALMDQLFREGYESHIRIYDCIKNYRDIDEKDYDICMNSYIKSFESNNTLESAANYIGWILLVGVATIYNMIDGYDELNEKQNGMAELIRKFYLRSFDEDLYEEVEDQRRKEREEFIGDYQDDIVTLLRALKASPQWADLADYYIAYFYICCMGNNDLSDNMNQAVGYEMMYVNATLGNKYANTFVQLGIELRSK